MENLADLFMIIDLQNGVCRQKGQEIPRLDDVITLANTRCQEYAQAKKPILFIQHTEAELPTHSLAWELLPDLHTQLGTHFLEKTHANAFFQTNLQALLEELSVASIELCGAQTEYCMDATIKFAHGSGYLLSMKHGASLTWDNPYLPAEKTLEFYEKIWDKRFLTFLD